MMLKPSIAASNSYMTPRLLKLFRRRLMRPSLLEILLAQRQRQGLFTLLVLDKSATTT
jgi:hypothetical protein